MAASSSTAIRDQKGSDDTFGPYKKIIDQMFSKGLIVFSGLYNDKPVAISRIRRTLNYTRAFYDRKEIYMLRKRNNDSDEYFAKIFDTEIDTNFRYNMMSIIIQYCLLFPSIMQLYQSY